MPEFEKNKGDPTGGQISFHRVKEALTFAAAMQASNRTECGS
jgi:hypothetical protein